MKEVLSAADIEQIRKIPMLFVLGVGRSGTTLFQNSLNEHHNLVAPPETDFAIKLYPKFAHIKQWTEKNITDLINALYDKKLLTPRWSVDLDRELLTSHLLSSPEKLDYALICKIIFFNTRKGKKDIMYFSNKKPIYAFFVRRLLKLFPEAKFIHIVREPRDNLYSHIVTFKLTNTLFRAQHWMKYNQEIERQKKKTPEKYFTLRYEDFVTYPAQELKKVCAFLQIPYSDSMLINTFPDALKALQEKKKNMERTRLIHQNLMMPINTANIGKWENKLSNYNRIIVETISGDFANKYYGYNISKPRNKTSVPGFRILKARLLFFLWKIFIVQRFKHYRFNAYYQQKKRENNKRLNAKQSKNS